MQIRPLQAWLELILWFSHKSQTSGYSPEGLFLETAKINRGNIFFVSAKYHEPRAIAAAVAVAVHGWLVTLTCTRQQTNTPNTHITLLRCTGAVCMQCVFLQSSLGSRTL